jgi:chromate transporter
MSWSLFWRFALISLLAVGGGATVPLVERIAVGEQRWIDSEEFAVAFAFGQVTPGPVLVMATFIGYRVAGPAGALAATGGSFLLPWFLGALAARRLTRPDRPPWLVGFTRGATAAAVGLCGASAVGLVRHAGPGLAPPLIAAAALGLSLGTRVHPALVLLGGAVLGSILGITPAAGPAG